MTRRDVEGGRPWRPKVSSQVWDNAGSAGQCVLLSDLETHVVMVSSVIASSYTVFHFKKTCFVFLHNS